MSSVPLKLIPKQYLNRVRGQVHVRAGLANEVTLPEIVVDRLACDRSQRVLLAVANRHDLTLPQIKKLMDSSHSREVRRVLVTNMWLSCEAVKHLIETVGEAASPLFANPQIKASEFVGLVMSSLQEWQPSNWAKRNSIRSALSNSGVGSTALIALSEELRKTFRLNDEIETMYQYLLSNEKLTSKSLEWLWKRLLVVFPIQDKADSIELVAASIVCHENCKDELIDRVLLSLKGDRLRRATREFEFREGYMAGHEVVDAVLSLGWTSDAFIVKHFREEDISLDLLTQVVGRADSRCALAILTRGLIENEALRETAVLVALNDDDSVRRLSDLGLVQAHHVENMVNSNSWRVRLFAAESSLVSEKSLKRLAGDRDADVSRGARKNPKWLYIKDSVEFQERAVEAVARIHRMVNCVTDVLPTLEKDNWEKDYEVCREFVQAIRTLAKPEFLHFLDVFVKEEQRELMKDGVDLETLNELEQFFE